MTTVRRTKAEIVEYLCAALGQTQPKEKIQMHRIVTLLLKYIRQELLAGHEVILTDIGVLQVRTRKARAASNPQTRDPIVIPQRKVVHLQQNKSVKRDLNPKEEQA